MKETITKTTYTCDKCRKEITDVAYILYCYAEPVSGDMQTVESATQNIRQNMAKLFGENHLCRYCKDALTDGVFIL